jgi:hypothetical protein
MAWEHRKRLLHRNEASISGDLVHRDLTKI